MTRRDKRRFQKGNRNFKEKEQRLNKMLDIGKLEYFRYDTKEIFNYSNIDPKTWEPLLASLITKASRLGIQEAKAYLSKLESEQIITPEISTALIRLLDKYKKWR